MSINLKPVLLYYVHHHGSGHRNTFKLLAPELLRTFNIVVITQDPSKMDLNPEWNDTILLEALPSKFTDADASFVHTFSRAFEGIPTSLQPAKRSHALSQIILRHQPSVFFCDGSPELAIMARSMGLKVCYTRLPGDIEKDPTQSFALQVAAKVVALFPGAVESPTYAFKKSTEYLGYWSKYDKKTLRQKPSTNDVAVVLGNDNMSEQVLQLITSDTSRRFHIIGNKNEYDIGDHCVQHGRVDDVARYLHGSIVISAGGLNTIAELLSLDKKLIILPEPRPYDEQLRHAEQLHVHGLALLASEKFSAKEWSNILRQAEDLPTINKRKLFANSASRKLREILEELAA